MAWTLANIRDKVRRLSGKLSSNDVSDSSILNYINNFYQEIMPAELHLPELESWYEFRTSVNDEDYSLTSTQYSVVAPIYVNGELIKFYTDPSLFYADYPQTFDETNIGTGDASTVAFSGTVTNLPIRPGTVVVDDAVETFTDNAAGVLTGDAGGSGTVNYTTGAIAVTFNSAPADGATINVHYEFWSTGRPNAALFFERELVLRPAPDAVYTIKAKSSTKPTAFSADSDVPIYNDWGKLIAYGAAIDLVKDYEGISHAIKLEPEYRHQMAIVQRRYVRQYEDNRAIARF